MLTDFLTHIRYPDNGKNIIFVENGEFHSGMVFGRHAAVGHTPLAELTAYDRLVEVVQAADGLRVSPCEIEKRLEKGKKVIFTPRKK